LADETDGDIQEMLHLRLLMSKTSVKKYEAVMRSVCRDNRVRGMMRFCGASRTGRWSGNILQPQNLPQNHLPDLTLARDIVKDGDFEMLDMAFGNVPNVLSELIRTVLIPKPNHRFIVADFSAIEARVLSWLAGEQWRLDTFRNGGDIYCASASRMFRVPVEKHGVNGHLRQKGKQAELGCGYAGGVGALKSMGAVELGIPEEELPTIVNNWRNANPHIVKLWTEVGNAAMKAIKEKTIVSLGKLVFMYERGILFIRLPSGRRLSYIKPRIGTNRFGGDSITYMGVGTSKKWERLETFGGKLVENIVQAIARDLLASAMINVANAGYNIVFHVHDEIIAEAPDGQGSVNEMCMLMSINPDWADGIPLSADGYECEYYRKD
ncbi:MAG: DNA polymerase, partial [Hominilimicola sp.]